MTFKNNNSFQLVLIKSAIQSMLLVERSVDIYYCDFKAQLFID